MPKPRYGPNPKPIKNNIPANGQPLGSVASGVVVLAMLVGVLFFGAWYLLPNWGSNDHDNKDEHRQVVPPKPKPGKTLTGSLIFVHARDPMSPAIERLLVEADNYRQASKDANGVLAFDYRSLDVKDKSKVVQDYIANAAKVNVSPPFMVHISNAQTVRYLPMGDSFEVVTKAVLN